MAAIHNPKYHITYLDAPSLAAQRLTLTEEGPLKCGAEHWLAKGLPDLFMAGAGGGAFGTFSYHATEFVFANAWLVDADMLMQKVAWHIDPARLTKLQEDLDATGALPWRAFESVEEARDVAHAAALKMSAAQRTLRLADLVMQPVIDSNTFWDHVSAKLLGADKMPELLWQYRMCSPYSYTRQEWNEGPFEEAVSHMLRATGAVGIFDVSARGQAVTMAAWLKRTRPVPTTLAMYAAPDDVASEVERRAAAEEENRFAPLFEAGWRRAYPQLSELWPEKCEGGEAAQLAGSLLAQLELGSKLTNFSTAALAATVAPHLSELDTAVLRAATNRARSAALVKILHKRKGAGTAESEAPDGLALGGKGTANEAWDTIHAQQPYKVLYAALEALNREPINFAKITEALAKAECPLGLAFLAGCKPPPQPVWALLLPARHESGIQAMLNSAIAVDKLGTPRPDWASLISTGDSKKFIMGLWGQGLGGEKKTGLSLWELVKAAIAKTDGEHVAARFASSLAPKSFYGDHIRIEYAASALPALFKCIGLDGREAGSLKSFLHGLGLRAKTVFDMPEIQQKAGLRELLEKAGTLVVEEAAMAHQLMLASPMAVAKRPKAFMDPLGAGAKEIVNFDAQLVAVQAQLELMALGLGNGTLLQSPAKQGRGYQGDQSWTGQEESWKRPKGLGEWGSAAAYEGVWSTPEGLVFGNTFIAYPDHAKLACPAMMAPGRLESRHKWCPKQCTTEDAHKRPDGADEKMPQVPSADATVAGSEWTAIATRRTQQGGPSGGRGAQGGRGRGGANGAKGDARGKGKGDGKGAAKGKGKGKGGGKGQKGKGHFRGQ